MTTKRSKNGLLSVLIVLTLLCAAAAFALGGAGSGTGTKDDPYLIATKADMIAFRDAVNGGSADICAKLTADINLQGSKTDE